MDKETRLEEKVRRLMVSTNGYPSYALLPLEILVKHADFVFMCKVVALAIAEEREACAVIAEGEGHYMCEDVQDAAKSIADLIRARSEP